MFKLEDLVEKNPIDLSLKILARELDKMNSSKTLKFQKLHPDVKSPLFAKEGDMCFDIFADSDKEITDHYIEYKTGLRFEIPEGYDMLVFPRSSISNYDLVLANSVGVIDNQYRGELLIRFKIVGTRSPKIYLKGDKIAQGVLIRKHDFVLGEVEGISIETNRGQGGFGSTGK